LLLPFIFLIEMAKLWE